MASEWELLAIEDVCHKVTSGGTPSRTRPDFYAGGTHSWVKTQELVNDWLDDTEEYITDEAISKSSAKVLPEQTILMAMYGATVGQLGILRRPMTCNQACCAMIVDEAKTNARFLFYQLKQNRLRFQNLATGAAQQNLNAQVIKRTQFLFPPLPEQRAIAGVLGALDDKIEVLSSQNRTLERMARALFRSWFVRFDPVRRHIAGEGVLPPGAEAGASGVLQAAPELAALFPAAFEDSALGPIPQGWQVSTIGEQVRVVGGGTPSTKDAEYWEGGTHCWVTPKDLAALSLPVLLDTDRRVTDAGLKKISSGALPVGAVLLSSRAPIGYLAVAEIPVAINQGFIAMTCDGELKTQYILHWARENMEAIKSRSNGTTFQEVSKTNFRPLPVLVPPSGVLTAFEEIAGAWHQRMVANMKEARTLAALRDALLPRLLSGALRIPVEAEAAS